METFRIPKYEAVPDTLDKVCAEIVRQCLRHKVKVTIQMDRADRSEEQNGALFGVAYPPIMQHTGYRKEELHEVFCRAYFGEAERVIAGRVIVRPKRTTTTDELGQRDVISKLDFARFYEFVQQVSAEHWGVNVPDPDKHWRQNLEVA